MLKKALMLGMALLLTACGGGGGGGGGSSQSSTPVTQTPPTPPPPAANTVAVTVDGGPAGLSSGPNGYIQDNVPYVSVTLCAPGTTNCQTIDHVSVDTGSVGLRILQSAISPTLLAALPLQTDAGGNPVGECYQFVDGYVFGSVRSADFKIGGEAVAGMPFQAVADTGVFSTVPSSCSGGGGTNENTLQALGSNGIIGIGVTTTDCGTACTVSGGSSSAIYYDCPTTGCSATITRTPSTVAPFQQAPNPVAAFATDNNGTIVSLPAAPAGGEASLSGTLIFGIGTQTNNGLGSATVLTTTTSASPTGAGLITAVYKGQQLTESVIDSGTNLYIFNDSSIAACTGAQFTGYYCPTAPLSLSATLQGQNGMSAAAPFTVNNAKTLLTTSFSVLPGIASNPSVFANPFPNSFDFGMPFFYGRNIYTAIEGRNAGGTVGPYFAY
ncbi:MAG TPA: DUF3443 family protein [Caulobacteraceae bacterium]|jgi:hypothetical protein|nr:DUF3443 family protein [Caulobacteraceae bacterium]